MVVHSAHPSNRILFVPSYELRIETNVLSTLVLRVHGCSFCGHAFVFPSVSKFVSSFSRVMVVRSKELAAGLDPSDVLANIVRRILTPKNTVSWLDVVCCIF